MDLSLSDEQLALRATAADFLRAAFPPERLARIADGVEQRDASLWGSLAELGWLGVSVPESLGGAGMGLAEEAIVLEEAGAVLLPAPLLATVGLALPALLAVDADTDVKDVAEGHVRATLAWAEPGGDSALSLAGADSVRATPSARGATITGSKTFVPHGDDVDLLVVVAATPDGPALFAVEAGGPGVLVERLRSMDTTRPLASVSFDDAPARALASAADTGAVIRSVWRRTMTLACAEALGVARAALDLAREHAASRSQFGRVIGTYQAVSHQLANTYIELELSRSLVMWAALSVDGDDGAQADLAVCAACAKALPAAASACERAIQVHGGIGTTWESPLHRYYKRAIGLAALDGPPSRQRARVASAVLDGI